MGMRHDGSMELLTTFTKQGIFQYSENAIAKKDEVEIYTLLQKNYNPLEKQSVTLHKTQALELARNIIKHYGEEA